MNQQRLMKVILAPVVSEKSNLLAEKRNQMTFKVLPVWRSGSLCDYSCNQRQSKAFWSHSGSPQ